MALPEAVAGGASLHSGHQQRRQSRLPSTFWGVFAAFLLAASYVALVSLASGSWSHMVAQVRQDWLYLVLIIGGFGLQVGLVSALRRARAHHGLAASSTAGSAASVVGMVACCAHHIADLLPFLAATGAAAFLTSYRVGFMVVGIVVTVVGVALAGWRLHRIHAHHRPHLQQEEFSCDAPHAHSHSGSH